MKKESDLFISAVIVAAGRGTRMNMDINKQYVDICGKSVLARTLQAFEDSGLIDEIILVGNTQDLIYCKQNIITAFGFNKVKTLVPGGKERQESVFNGLSEVSKQCDIVLIHDGARPFVNEASIKESITAAYKFGASCVAVPVKDTIKTADTEKFAGNTLDRSTLWAVQTPQAFKYEIIMKAHRKGIEDEFKATDDAVLVERLGVKVKLVMGSYDNIKITTKEDLIIAQAIAQLRS